MFQGVAPSQGGLKKTQRRPRCLQMDMDLLGVKWRFLNNLTNGNGTGSARAWMRPQSLLKEVHRREKEYHDAIIASLAHELGVTNVFPAPVQRDGINQLDIVRNTLQANHTSGVCLNLTCGTSSEPKPIQEVETNNTEDTGESVDLSTTPCIQRRGETASLPPPSREEYVNCTNKLSCKASARPSGQHVNDNSENSGMTAAIPETCPASLVFKPRLREAQETKGGPPTVNLKVDQVGLSLEHMPLVLPRRPQKTRPSERLCPRRDRKVVQKRVVEAAPEKPKFRHASPPTQTYQRSSYGKAWYMNPDLWGRDGSRKTANSMVQESDGTEETKEQEALLARMEAVKGGAIPTLFSAVRFVKYIRQQGFRMPAHLESTDRAMEMETNVRARRSGNTKKMAMAS